MKTFHFLPLICLFLFTGCVEPPALPAPVPVLFSAQTDQGSALPGAAFTTGKQTFGTSDERGEVSVRVQAPGGARLPVRVTCPPGYKDPKDSFLDLAGSPGATKAAREPLLLRAICVREVSEIALVVRAGGVPGIAVWIDGEQAGVTDENGNAHLLLERPVGAPKLTVRLDTSGHPDLRPVNPERTLEHQDGLVLLDQLWDSTLPSPVPARAPRVQALPAARQGAPVPASAQARAPIPSLPRAKAAAPRHIPYKTNERKP